MVSSSVAILIAALPALALAVEAAEPPNVRGFPSPACRIWIAADGDADGAVTPDERRSFLTQLDPDGDGQVEPSDADPFLVATRGGDPGEVRMRDRFILRGALDADRDGKLELAAIDALFGDLDGDGDGRLSPAELPALPRERPARRREALASPSDVLLRILDADHDGSVVAAEWSGFLDRADVDGDGALDEAELTRALPQPPGGEVGDDWIVELLDHDADGRVQRAELASFIEAADSDRNGTVEAVERSALRARDARAAGAPPSDPEAGAAPERPGSTQ